MMSTQSSGPKKTTQQAKNAIELRKALFGNSLLVDTQIAAGAINRSVSTLRKWALRGDGPIQAVRADGHLLWRVTDLMTLSGDM